MRGLRQDTPAEDRWVSTQDLEDLEADARQNDDILENWSTPLGSPWEVDERIAKIDFDVTSLTQFESWDTEEEDPEDANIFLVNSDTTSDSLPELISRRRIRPVVTPQHPSEDRTVYHG